MTEPIRITRTTHRKDKPKDKDLAFGNVFTDHMFVADFEEEKGWYDPRVEPYGPFSLDPATAVLHYGQSLFEGLKGFRGGDGKIRLFRPDKHVARLNRTAERMCIPPIDADLILKSWTTLVDVDRDWVPSAVGTSLYIRPTVIASEPFLGVRPARQYLYYVILSPVGPYYPEGLAPTKIKVIDNYVRAVAGGLGEAKTSANYAASLFAAEEAKHEGFTQVLWLDGVQHRYIEEVGTSTSCCASATRSSRRRWAAPSWPASPVTPPSRCCAAGACAWRSARSRSTRWWPRPSGARCVRCGRPVPPPSSRRWASWPTRADESWSTRAASVSWPSGCTTRSLRSSTGRRPTRTAGR